MHIFLDIIIQVGHDIRDTMNNYWSSLEQFCTPFYNNIMKRNQFFHMLRYLYFSNNMYETDNIVPVLN